MHFDQKKLYCTSNSPCLTFHWLSNYSEGNGNNKRKFHGEPLAILNSGHRSEDDNALECLWRSVLNNVVITWINECCNPFSGCYFTIVSKLFNLKWTSWKTESVVREIFKRVVVSLCERWKGTCRLTSNICLTSRLSRWRLADIVFLYADAILSTKPTFLSLNIDMHTWVCKQVTWPSYQTQGCLARSLVIAVQCSDISWKSQTNKLKIAMYYPHLSTKSW